MSLVVLGIAIGLNTSFFTVVAGLVLRPMPGITDASRVATVSRAIGIRMALGAVAASQVLFSSLYGVSPMAPIAYGAVVLVIAIAALAASYVPVRRAVRVDPARALRYD